MQAGQKSGPPRLRPCLRAVWAVAANVAGVPPSGGSPARFSFWGFRWCFYVCCCLSVLWCVCPSVAGSFSLPGPLSVCAVPLSCPALPVALCGGGFGGGSVGLGLPVLLCVRCRRSPRGRCPLRVAAPLWVLSLAADPGRSGPDRRQFDHQREEKPPSGNQQTRRRASLDDAVNNSAPHAGINDAGPKTAMAGGNGQRLTW